MEKQYLDYNGLTDVAGHVNTRLKTVTTMPVSADNGAVRLYVGTTTDTYIRGHIYQYNSTDSEWVDITSSGQFIQYSTMPTASADIVNKIVQDTGTTNQNYTNGYFYKCTLSGSNYIWTNINVQAGGSGSDNIVNGYFNPTDNLFYEESTYTTPITGASNVLYISLDTDFSYRYNGSIFVRVDKEIDDTTTSSSKTWSSNKISSEITGIIGSIVTPTDDIQTWLKCANLTESYTTLSSVLADDDVMEKLFRSKNACDYLVRSTTWASDICTNQTAMILIGKNDYCADLLLNDSTWKTAIGSSSYWKYVLLEDLAGLIPAMTSNTTPSGVCSSSGNHATFQPYMAFSQINTGVETDWYASQGTTGKWIQYEFPSAVLINRLHILSTTRPIASSNLQASNDNSTWVQLADIGAISANAEKTVDFSNLTLYKYYRYNGVPAIGPDNDYYLGIRQLQLYGRVSKTTIYSAANDIVSFIDDEGAKVVTTDATGKGEVNIVCKPNTDITFTSSVAKNPNNLSENYSKVVTVKSSVEPVYVMPNKDVLYWYGYTNDFEEINATNGWTGVSGRDFIPCTFNTNNVVVPPYNAPCRGGVASHNSYTPSKVHGIMSTSSNDQNVLCIFDGRSIAVSPLAYVQNGVYALEHLVLNNSNNFTGTIGTYTSGVSSSTATKVVYAVWYDDDDADDKAEISAIGTNEDKPTASRAYAVGEHFYKDGKFCTCIQAIAQGAQFTLNTNYVEGTIADALYNSKFLLANSSKAIDINYANYTTYFTMTTGQIASNLIRGDNSTGIIEFTVKKDGIYQCGYTTQGIVTFDNNYPALYIAVDDININRLIVPGGQTTPYYTGILSVIALKAGQKIKFTPVGVTAGMNNYYFYGKYIPY